ncbi:hypothetical protein C0J52_00671 [Blattella germanica]|nr:hypothetical protein C0J52_00671 [Blattella germanica]
MLNCVIVCITLLLFAGIMKGCIVPRYNLSVSNIRNEKGTCAIELRMDHDSEHLYDIFVSNVKHSTIAKMSPSAAELGGSFVSSKTYPRPKAQGYEWVPGLGYYKLHTQESRAWEDAKIVCEDEGTHLLILNSALEALLIKTMVERNPKTKSWVHWVGFLDTNKTGSYTTIFNDTLESTGYKAWRQGQPSTDVSHKCGNFVFVPDRSTYGLGLFLCSHSCPFICELEIDS